MHNTQTPEDPDFDTDQEDFDFGEHETHDVPRATSTRPALNKSLLIGLLFVVIGTILGVGYRFLPKHAAQNSTPTLSHDLATRPATTPSPVAQKNPVQSVQIMTPTAHTLENSQDLEKAFEAADKVSTPIQTPIKESPTIPQAHQALFAPKAVPEPTHESAALSAELLRPLQEGLEKLHQQMDTIFGKMNYLDGYTQEMSSHLQRLHQAMMTMDQRLSNANALLDQRLSNLSTTTTTLSKDVGGVKNEVSQVRETLKDEGLDRPIALSSPDNTQSQAAVSMDNPEYQVHAVIPGRAWLKSTKGTIITVAEGDSLGNYGKVLVIDAAHGLVLTSSGITFR